MTVESFAAKGKRNSARYRAKPPLWIRGRSGPGWQSGQPLRALVRNRYSTLRRATRACSRAIASARAPSRPAIASTRARCCSWASARRAAGQSIRAVVRQKGRGGGEGQAWLPGRSRARSPHFAARVPEGRRETGCSGRNSVPDQCQSAKQASRSVSRPRRCCQRPRAAPALSGQPRRRAFQHAAQLDRVHAHRAQAKLRTTKPPPPRDPATPLRPAATAPRGSGCARFAGLRPAPPRTVGSRRARRSAQDPLAQVDQRPGGMGLGKAGVHRVLHAANVYTPRRARPVPPDVYTTSSECALHCPSGSRGGPHPGSQSLQSPSASGRG